MRRSELLHPVSLLAIALLVVNDHVLKGSAPGWLTGKLSDVAGLVFFPLLVTALAGRRWRAVAIAATGIGFAAIKLWEPARILAEYTLGALQNPFDVQPVVITPDVTDLFALPALAIAWWIHAATRRWHADCLGSCVCNRTKVRRSRRRFVISRSRAAKQLT